MQKGKAINLRTMKSSMLHTALLLLLLALSSGTMTAQGLMRGEASPGGEGPAMEQEYFTVGNDVSSASLGIGAEAGSGQVDVGFGEAIDAAAVSEMSETEMAIALVKLSRQNKELRAEAAEGELLRGEIRRLQDEIDLLEGGWEPVQE